ncbi:hypothetical protein LBMAG53_21800 [Planctomycetota bacterium]|nr:hypothetical protein LBMAG53_21800 [Planctomycetota bacterium]
MITINEIFFKKEIGVHVNDDLKEFVNMEIDKGRYIDGYDIAVKNGQLTSSEIDEIYSILDKQNLIDKSFISGAANTYKKYIYSTVLASYLWVDASNIIITNGLNLIRYSESEIKWETPRISWDGIECLRLFNDTIVGKWFEPPEYWSDFVVDYENGVLLKGQIISH